MIALVEGASRQKTPNEIALTIVLAAFSIIFLIVTASLYPMARYFDLTLDIPTLIALLVCLIPTTIGALLAAIGIAGMDRALAANIIAKSGKAVEVAGDIDTLLLDKTGTITIGNRRATQFVPLGGADPREVARLAGLASMADPTPEGKSILDLARQQSAVDGEAPAGSTFIEFTAQNRMSGVDLPDGTRIRKGAPDTVARYVQDQGGTIPDGYQETVDAIASGGRHAAGRRRGGPDRRRDQARGHPQAGHLRAVRPAPPDGPAGGDGHRRQPADRQGDRRAGGRRRLHRPGHARGQARLHPQGAGGRQARRHDGRRHQRRPRAGPGRHRRGDELRDPGRQGGRQHGRPRQRPHQAHRGRRDRQAAADDPRGPDHVLDRQRPGQVLRRDPGPVHRHPARAARSST